MTWCSTASPPAGGIIDYWLAAKPQKSAAANAENRRLAIDVRDRLRGLYGDLDDHTGRPTADQLSELAYYRSVVERLER